MAHDDLLTRLMHHDMNAYMEMTEKYSWSVYSLIRDKISDKREAEAVFDETMNGFYRGLSENGGKDPLEALLLMYADKVCRLNSVQTTEAKPSRPEEKMPKTAVSSNSGEKEMGGFLYFLIVLLLVATIMAVIWMILGLLMDMNFIPDYDLGYSWFNTHILPWF